VLTRRGRWADAVAQLRRAVEIEASRAAAWY